MSTPIGRPTGVFLLLGGMLYVVLLAAALIWLHISPDMVLLLTLGGIGIPVVCLRPVIGVHVFLMILYIEPSLGENVVVMKAIGAVILAGWLCNVSFNRVIRLRLNSLIVVIVLFVIWCGVTAMVAEDTESALLRTFQFLQMAIAALMFGSVVDTTRKIRALYGAIVLWSTLTAVVAIGMYYLGMTSVARGLVYNRNLLAMHLNIAIIAAYVLFQTARSPVVKGILMAAFPVFFLGLGLSLSRTGLLVLALSLSYLWFRFARERGLFIIGGTLTALCLVCAFLPDAFWHRVATILPSIERQEDTFGLRVKIWRVGLAMVQDHPITGVGAGNFLSSFGHYAHGRFLWRHLSPHNAFVSVGSEMGLVGLAIFVMLLWLALSTARRAIRSGVFSERQEVRFLAIAAEVSLLAQIIACFTGDVESFKLLWITFGMMLSLERLGQEALESRRLETSRAHSESLPVSIVGLEPVR